MTGIFERDISYNSVTFVNVKQSKGGIQENYFVGLQQVLLIRCKMREGLIICMLCV